MVRINASALASYLFRGRGLILMIITWPVDDRISVHSYFAFSLKLITDHQPKISISLIPIALTGITA